MPVTYKEFPVSLDPSALRQRPRFLKDVLKGLRSTPKKLDAKYFYDETGDALFQKIMNCEEYYVTRCEAEIFQTHAAELAAALKEGFDEFDLIELGAGDASKTIHLLKELKQINSKFRYVPVDISSTIIQYLEQELPRQLDGLAVQGLAGEYLEMLRKAGKSPSQKKVILFLGSNIGNMDLEDALNFLREVRANLNKGDRMLIGCDLKKDPATVLAAYNDASGYTRAFNLNLLERINRELGGNFDLSQFEHYPTYDPISGACKSFLVSKREQSVSIADETVRFKKGEVIFMELSQKYDLAEIESMATSSGFRPAGIFTDNREWFVDSVWQCV